MELDNIVYGCFNVYIIYIYIYVFLVADFNSKKRYIQGRG